LGFCLANSKFNDSLEFQKFNVLHAATFFSRI